MCANKIEPLEREGRRWKEKMTIYWAESWSSQSALSFRKDWLEEKWGRIGRHATKFIGRNYTSRKFFLENSFYFIYLFIFCEGGGKVICLEKLDTTEENEEYLELWLEKEWTD